jgi:hypothetical protein
MYKVFRNDCGIVVSFDIWLLTHTKKNNEYNYQEPEASFHFLVNFSTLTTANERQKWYLTLTSAVEIMFGVVYCGTLSSKGGKHFCRSKHPTIPQSFSNTLNARYILCYVQVAWIKSSLHFNNKYLTGFLKLFQE